MTGRTGGPQCRKTPYPTREVAWNAMNMLRRVKHPELKRVYECLICHYWHATSQEHPA